MAMSRFSGVAVGAHAPANTAPAPEHAPASAPGPRRTRPRREVPGQAREAVHFTPVSAQTPANTAPAPAPGPRRVRPRREVPGQAREAVHFTPAAAHTPTNTAPAPEHAPAPEPGTRATLTRSRGKPGTGEWRR